MNEPTFWQEVWRGVVASGVVAAAGWGAAGGGASDAAPVPGAGEPQDHSAKEL